LIVPVGDSVVIPAPYWPSYPDMVKMCYANPVIFQTSAENNYNIVAEELDAILASDQKVSCLILCNPSNPTGCVSNLESLTAISEVLRKYPQVRERHKVNLE